jgi:hypothetical protein
VRAGLCSLRRSSSTQALTCTPLLAAMVVVVLVLALVLVLVVALLVLALM